MRWGRSEDKSHQAMTHRSGGWVSHLSEILSSLAAHWYNAVPNAVRLTKKGNLILAKYKKKNSRWCYQQKECPILWILCDVI